MTKPLDNADYVIAEGDLDADFEYNFDLNPFSYLLQGIHALIAVPGGFFVRFLGNLSDRLRRFQQDQAFRRTLKGPACMLK